MPRPSGREISSVISFLPRDMVFHHSGVSPLCGGHSRSASAVPGFSALMTSAPKSARSEPTKGPANMEPSSKTRTSPRAGARCSFAVIASCLSDAEAMRLRIIRVDHELMEARKMRGAGDLRHPGIERAHLRLRQHAAPEQRAGDTFRDDRLVFAHQATMNEDAHHMRGAGAARRAVEGAVREHVDVLVAGIRCAARPPDGDE